MKVLGLTSCQSIGDSSTLRRGTNMQGCRESVGSNTATDQRGRRVSRCGSKVTASRVLGPTVAGQLTKNVRFSFELANDVARCEHLVTLLTDAKPACRRAQSRKLAVDRTPRNSSRNHCSRPARIPSQPASASSHKYIHILTPSSLRAPCVRQKKLGGIPSSVRVTLLDSLLLTSHLHASGDEFAWLSDV